MTLTSGHCRIGCQGSNHSDGFQAEDKQFFVFFAMITLPIYKGVLKYSYDPNDFCDHGIADGILELEN